MTAIDPPRLAVDIGGTFTDVVLRHPAGDTAIKVLTTHDDPADGVVAGVEQVLAESGVRASNVRLCVHGTTLATNALIERRGATTALLTTEGHRDALEMAFENRFEQYDIGIDRPAPLVPRELRLPVRERLGARGQTLLPLDEASVLEAIGQLRASGVTSVAIGLLHAWRDDRHERQVAAIVERELPGVALSLSSQVCPEIREYERLSTTCANAYVLPLMARYLATLERRLAEVGVTCPVLMMTSGGGLTDLRTAARFPIRLVESGPAGGAILAARIAAGAGIGQCLSFDMGGTTAKLCLIDNGRPALSRAFEVDRAYRFRRGSGLPVRIPVIEMVEIGAGGGSIARIDKLGRLQVGPASAGSQPGPASYGQGGTEPTVTDADVELGKLLPERFAGGRLRLDAAAASRAIERGVASPLGLDGVQAARAIHEVVVENMAAAARAHATEWGKTAAGRTLVAYGGAGPLHACALANLLKIDRVVIPAGAGVGSALGFLLAPVSFEVVRSRYMLARELDPAAVRVLFAEMRAEARAVVERATDAPLYERRDAYMRYAGQGYELTVAVPDPTDPRLGDALVEAFESEYRALYGRTIPGPAIEILSFTLALATAPPPLVRVAPPVAMRDARPATHTPAAWGDTSTVPVYARERLLVGDRLAGPALVVESHTTTALSSGFVAIVDARNDLVLEREPID